MLKYLLPLHSSGSSSTSSVCFICSCFLRGAVLWFGVLICISQEELHNNWYAWTRREERGKERHLWDFLADTVGSDSSIYRVIYCVFVLTAKHQCPCESHFILVCLCSSCRISSPVRRWTNKPYKSYNNICRLIYILISTSVQKSDVKGATYMFYISRT